MRGDLYLSGRKKKIRRDLAGTSTPVLLEKVAAEALRLRDENQRLTTELKTALRRIKPPVNQEVKKAGKSVAAGAEAGDSPVAVVEKKAGPRRQALGTGLARFLGARRPL